MTKTILIADDEMDMRYLVRMSLAEYDLNFVEVKDGKSAFEQSKEAKPDLIIMDHSMPIMSGYEALKFLKQDEETRNIPVIMLTKARFDEDMKEIIKLDVGGFLEKPFSHEQLIKTIEKHLGGLPRKVKSVLGTDKPHKTPEEDSKGGKEMKPRILVADDVPEIRTLIRMILKDKYEVIEVKDGTKLIEETLRLSPSLIIADIMMPGLDGFRAIGRLRKSSSFSTTPVIFISAAIADKEQYIRLKPEGPSCFMIKPIQPKELLAKIKEFLKK